VVAAGHNIGYDLACALEIAVVAYPGPAAMEPVPHRATLRDEAALEMRSLQKPGLHGERLILESTALATCDLAAPSPGTSEREVIQPRAGKFSAVRGSSQPAQAVILPNATPAAAG
jgi:hypothetical protein